MTTRKLLAGALALLPILGLGARSLEGQATPGTVAPGLTEAFECRDLAVDPNDPEHYRRRGKRHCEGKYLAPRNAFYWRLISWTFGAPRWTDEPTPWMALAWSPDPGVGPPAALELSVESLRPELNYRLDAWSPLGAGLFRGSKRFLDLQGLAAHELGFLARRSGDQVYQPLWIGGPRAGTQGVVTEMPTFYQVEFEAGIEIARARFRIRREPTTSPSPASEVTASEVLTGEVPGAPFAAGSRARLEIPLGELGEAAACWLEVTISYRDENGQEELAELTSSYRFHHGTFDAQEPR